MLQDRSSTKVKIIEGFTRGLQNAPFRVVKDKRDNWWWWSWWCCTSSAFSSLPAFAKRSAKAWVTFKNSSPCSSLFIKSNQNFATNTRYKEGSDKKTPKLLLVQTSSHQVVGKRSAKAPLQCVPVKQKKKLCHPSHVYMWNISLLAPKVLFEDLWPMITIPSVCTTYSSEWTKLALDWSESTFLLCTNKH